MDGMEKTDGPSSRLKAVLYGLLAAVLWGAVMFLSVRAITSVAHDLEVVRTSDSYAGRTFTVSYDDLVFTQLGFGAEGASDEEIARSEVLSYFEECEATICERVFSTMVFYLLMLSTVVGAAVSHATRKVEGPFVSRFATMLVALYVVHTAVLAGAFIIHGVSISFASPASVVFIIASFASAIAGSAVLAAILAQLRFPVLAVIAAPVVLYFAFSFDTLFCAELLQALGEGVRPPIGALIFELLVPFSGSGISLATQILTEEGVAIPVWYAALYAVKALIWFEIARIPDRIGQRNHIV